MPFTAKFRIFASCQVFCDVYLTLTEFFTKHYRMIKFFKLIIIGTLFIVNTNYAQSKKQKQKEVYNKIVKANLKYPRIVLRQAIHESANFKSNAAVNKNNILGIMEGYGPVTNRKYRIKYFTTIDDCLEFYRERIQTRYNGGDYYRFLSRIGYAEDKHYIRKLKDTELYLE